MPHPISHTAQAPESGPFNGPHLGFGWVAWNQNLSRLVTTLDGEIWNCSHLRLTLRYRQCVPCNKTAQGSRFNEAAIAAAIADIICYLYTSGLV